ncbi:retrovirus-related pol polyprotein from transposon TNT 1-94, partial [Tanacetum coccineum]
MEMDSKIYRGKKERVKSIALKAKKEQPRDEKNSFRQKRRKKGKSDRKCFRCGDPNHLIGDCPKPSRNKDQKAFIGGSWSDSENDVEDKTNDETCLMDQSSNEVTLNSSYYSDNTSSLDNDSMQIEYDSLCKVSLKIINKDKILKTKRDLLEKEILELNEKIKKLERSKEIEIAFLLLPKLSPLVDDDVGEEEAIRKNTKIVNTNNEEDESIEVEEIVNIKESKNHLLDQFEMSMMGELNFFLGLQIKQMEDKIFFNQSKYIKEMLKKFRLEDSKPTKTLMSTEIKLTKDDEADSVDSSKYQGMIGSLLYLTASRPDIMFSVCLCARFQENPKTTHLEAVKRIFRYIRGTSHLGLWYPKGTGIETVVYADSDHAGDCVDCKSTSGVFTFMGCCLTSWFAKKQTALAISVTKAEYVSAGKACQQALWMKQALIDYGIRLDDSK